MCEFAHCNWFHKFWSVKLECGLYLANFIKKKKDVSQV